MNKFEIDCLIAEKILNWEVNRDEDGNLISYYDAPNETLYFMEDEEWREFTPSEDIGDAWKLVEKYLIQIITQSEKVPKENKYLAIVEKDEINSQNYIASAETAELAICKVVIQKYEDCKGD